MNFLYILKFIDEPLIKIGIASDLARVKTHHKTYGIRFENSYLIKAKNERIIARLEKTLLSEYEHFYPENNKYEGLDGYTEIRMEECLPMILEDLERKKNKEWLEISLEEGIIIPTIEIENKPTKPKKVKSSHLRFGDPYLKTLRLIRRNKKSLFYYEVERKLYLCSYNQELIKEIFEKSPVSIYGKKHVISYRNTMSVIHGYNDFACALVANPREYEKDNINSFQNHHNRILRLFIKKIKALNQLKEAENIDFVIEVDKLNKGEVYPVSQR